jgi:signal transduction histidine kinase
MSSLANVIELPVRHEFEERDSLGHDLVLALATADDLASGMDAVVRRIRRDAGAARAEWWAEDEDGALELVAVDGIARGGCHSLPLGPAGVFALHGGRLDLQVESALVSLAPIIRRRAAEERLARTTIQLAQHNETLEDFAALVAHDVRSSLLSALRSDNPRDGLTRALELVDSILEAERVGQRDSGFASATESVQQAVADLGEMGAKVSSNVTGELPIPPAALRVVLRNLLANAEAAGAHQIHVSAVTSGDRATLVVDDDGVGLRSTDRYATGAGLGLALSRRLLARFGGLLELKPRAVGGTRAVISIAGAHA